MKRLLIILIGLTFCVITGRSQVMPFNRHFIIVVDQTIKDEAAMKSLYNGLSTWLEGKAPSKYIDVDASTIPQSEPFDPKQDAISLFAFGMTGSGLKGTGDYWRIHNQCGYGRLSNAEAFKDVTKALIHKRSRYINEVSSYGSRSVEMSPDKYLSTRMLPLFDGSDPLHKLIAQQSGVTMSHFVYPLIMNFVSKEETANEYYLIIVSDFKSGQYSNNDQEDWNTFSGITAGKKDYKTYFEHQLNVLRSPFIQADYLHFQAGEVGIRGTRLMHKGVISKSQLYLGTNLNLEQSSGTRFNLSKAVITFDKDNNTTIDSIGVALYEDGKLLCYNTIVRGDDEVKKLLLKNSDREYEIPAQSSLNLGESNLGDVTVKYIFFTMSHDIDGNPVLPVSLTSQQTIEKSSITYINVQLRRNMTIIGSILLLIAFITFLYWRGRRKKVIVNVSNFAQKYIDVTKDSGTVELPCWFYVRGNEHNKIKVRGTVSPLKSLSIKGEMSLYVRLQEAKPAGFSYYINGDKCVEFTKIKLEKGKFEFDLDIAFNPEVVNPSELHRCSVMIDFLVESSFFHKTYHSDIGISPKTCDFFFIEDLGRAWAGFDPGTSGSCIAIGSPTGALADPSIAMVRTSEGNTEIIPSRIIFDHKLTSEDDNPMHLLPGVDYKYGVDANQHWAATAGEKMPHFQSIKKMLGYMKGDKDKKVVETSTGVMKLSGVDLAHLLVKGLEKELTDYVGKMPQAEKTRLINGDSLPRRAVVAIPNNYTLPKIQDMIESIKRLGQYKEIRFIYEAEGILFNYLRKSFSNSTKKSDETVMVFDMGGATINLSVFRIKYIHKGGSVYYHISTLGRIGYGVGGDNIDVALMEHIFSWLPISDDQRHELEKQNKVKILEGMLRLKKNIIYAFETPQEKREIKWLGAIYDRNSFQQFINWLLQGTGWNVRQMKDLQDLLAKETTKPFADFIVEDFLGSKEMEYFVYSKVEDAVNEIMDYPEIQPLRNIDNLLFAGRSTTFPYISSRVIARLRNKKGKKFNIVKFDDNPNEIKTAVAYGACWYGIYNGLVTLDNSRLTSAYGFKFTTESNTTLDILLDQNSKFGADNMAHGQEDIQSLFDGDGQSVTFYQVMGSGKEKDLFSEKNRFKMNYLIDIPVTQLTKSISIDVGRNNIATCSVTFDTDQTVSMTDIDIETRDIASENDWAYVFATTDEDNGKAWSLPPVQRSSTVRPSGTPGTQTRQNAERPKAPWEQTTWSDGRKKRY